MSTINFSIGGYGAEIAQGRITKKAAEFWLSDKMSDYFYDYVYGPDYFNDAWPDVIVPKYAKLSEWHEHENRGHEWGATFDGSARLTISNDEGDLFYGGVMEFIDDHELDVESEECYPNPNEYTLCSGNYEKGSFFEGSIEIDGEFDPTKVSFGIVEFHKDDLIRRVLYDGEEIDNDGSNGTDGKSLDFEIIIPWT